MKCPGQLEHEQDSYISWSMLFYPSSMHVELTRPEMGQIMLNLLDSQSMCTNYAATSRHDITVIWIRPLTYLWIWSQTGSDYQSVAQYSLVTTLSNELRTGHDHKSPLVICPVISKWCPPNWRPFPVNFMLLHDLIWLDNVMIWHGVEGEVALGIERSRNFSVWILLDVYRSTSCHQLCCGKCCMQRQYTFTCSVIYMH